MKYSPPYSIIYNGSKSSGMSIPALHICTLQYLPIFHGKLAQTRLDLIETVCEQSRLATDSQFD